MWRSKSATPVISINTLDIQGQDEIGQLARTFDAMVKYLREMAAVSEAIAGGNLTVEVQPRSPNDTLANAFTRMMKACAAWCATSAMPLLR